MQNYISVGERKLNDLQVRYDEMPNIFNKFEAAQGELELSDNFDHSADRESFEEQYFELKAKFMELLYPPNLITAPGDSNHASNNGSDKGSCAACSTHSNQSSRLSINLPAIELPKFSGGYVHWLSFRDTFESLIVRNTTLSNVQKLHYLLAALKDEAKALIVNLPITNENFNVAWGLIQQRYNNVKLIAMQHVGQLFQTTQTKKGDATSLHQLINFIVSNINAVEALSLNTSLQTLMLNHILLAALDADTHRACELRFITG
jgi:hypothetical protein